MAAQPIARRQRGTLGSALVITRREVRDSLKDWRIVLPVIALTLIFPFIMDFTSRWATNWVSQFTDPILVERLNPFLLMVVGFFPISFSLIIALESFVGEKERNSIEPILSMPLSDLELYLGKMLSSLALPVLAAYLGLTVFLVTRMTTTPVWVPSWDLALLMYTLTTVEALVMVAGAVVVSSQTTSVRAANLLASFIIIPMALLLQAESVVMFYAEYSALWWFVLALLVVAIIFVRMGVRNFNREEILSREMDELHPKLLWRDFWGYFLRPPEKAAQRANKEAARFQLVRFYRHDIPLLFNEQRLAGGVILLGVAAAIIFGVVLARQYPIPPGSFSLDGLTAATFEQLRDVPGIPSLSTTSIFFNNLRVIVVASVLSVFSFGALVLFLTLVNLGLVGFIIAEVTAIGLNPWLFLATFILPHGVLELPALIIGLTFALRMGAAMMSPPHGLDVGQALLLTTANFVKILLFVVVPLLLLAAFVEANVTPQIVLFVYGR